MSEVVLVDDVSDVVFVLVCCGVGVDEAVASPSDDELVFCPVRSVTGKPVRPPWDQEENVDIV